MGLKQIADRLLGRDGLSVGHVHTPGHESGRPHLGKKGRAHQASSEAQAHIAADAVEAEQADGRQRWPVAIAPIYAFVALRVGPDAKARTSRAS